MKSSGEFILQKVTKPADRQGQPTVKEIILNRMRAKLNYSQPPASSLSEAKKPASITPPQTIQEAKG